MSNSIELAFGHSQDDIATTFCIAKLLFAIRVHFATIDPVPDLNLFVASVGQTYQRPSAGGCSVDTDQIDFSQVECLHQSGFLGHACI